MSDPAFFLCLRNEKYHKEKTITMRYKKDSLKLGVFDSKEVKVDSSLRAPFKELLKVLEGLVYCASKGGCCEGSKFKTPPGAVILRGIKEGENLVSEISITWSLSNIDLACPEEAQIKVHFVEGYMREPLVISIQNCRVFFKALSLELGFQPALGEQHLKGLPQPQFFAKVHRMIAIHALGVTPNKTANL